MAYTRVVQEILKALEIDHIPAHMIEETLQGECMSLEDLKSLVDAGFHQGLSDPQPDPQSTSQSTEEWSEDLVHQLNPKRMFYPGQTYSPEDLSPHTRVDYSKIREEKKQKGCPLGGKKGPKIDFTNVALLSRFVHILCIHFAFDRVYSSTDSSLTVARSCRAGRRSYAQRSSES